MSLRHELAVPFRGLHPRHALAGSAVLLGAARRGLSRALTLARQTSAATSATSKRPAPAAKPEKIDATGATPAATTRRQAAGDRAEQLGMTVLVGGFVLAALGSAAVVVAHHLAPYARGLVFSFLAGWYLLAAAVAPGEDQEDDDTPENDHEKSAGEQPKEEDPWSRQRETIRRFVEHEVAAGAAGHRVAKGKGARVDDLTARLFPDGTPDGWDRRSTVDLLWRCGISVRDQMKFQFDGKAQTPPGVHVDDLAKDLGRTPQLPPHLVPAYSFGEPPTLGVDPTPQQQPDGTPREQPDPTPQQPAPVQA
ncbi:hypothetical protein SUDANB1_05623 [Streptomyces sp. enrichment culture]|uniref:hypothetical protein n=1 Tax=Streptomyces sp. enrichment culture TaxID=1795815 RepID=UPI003F57903D